MDSLINTPLTVSEITGEIKSVIESEFDNISVIGEISNFKAHFSGHWYFTLKDNKSAISCAMWKGYNNYVFFTPEDGMKVILKGKVTVYPPRGSYQVDVRSMQPAGQGELQMAYERMKARLSDEGLFDEAFKKDIPRFPQKIGLVTASDGAAIRDMISVAQRRYPVAEIIVGGCKVQGEGAAEEICQRIKQFNLYTDVDVLIVGRGGGSLEDLWAFNEEIVAREIFNSEIPVISAVGHEIDFTIADFVADLRAPTPSAAMELATPDKDEILGFIDDFSYNAGNNILSKIDFGKREIKNILSSYGFRSPVDRINTVKQTLDHLTFRFEKIMSSKIKDSTSKLDLLTAKISANNTNKILKKGFTLIKQNNKSVKRSNELEKDNPFIIKFYDKEIEIKND